MKKKLGRPKLPKENSKTELLQIRLTKSERGTIEQVAKAAGMTLSEWARSTLGLSPASAVSDLTSGKLAT